LYACPLIFKFLYTGEERLNRVKVSFNKDEYIDSNEN